MRRIPRPVKGLDEAYYRVSDVALALGVDPGTVVRWIHAGDIDARRRGARGMFLIPHRSLVAAGLLAGAADENSPEPVV